LNENKGFAFDGLLLLVVSLSGVGGRRGSKDVKGKGFQLFEILRVFVPLWMKIAVNK